MWADPGKLSNAGFVSVSANFGGLVPGRAARMPGFSHRLSAIKFVEFNMTLNRERPKIVQYVPGLQLWRENFDAASSV